MEKYVAYYRVSTDKQGMSGLRLDAQRAGVERFAQAGQIIADFTEIESGPSSRSRSMFAARSAPSCSSLALIGLPVTSPSSQI